MPIYHSLQESILLDDERQAELNRSVTDGFVFFKKFNESRLELAFSSFSEDMKKALFEVIYFLHVNDPKYEDHTYNAVKVEKVNGAMKEVEVEEHICLYEEGAISGVVGIDSLSKQFKDQFEEFIKEELDATIEPKSGFSPIYSIASLGSIGTVGHKTTASDLDLQVQYELLPFLFDAKQLTDDKLVVYANKLIAFYSRKFRLKKGYSAEDLKKSDVKQTVIKAGHHNFRKNFPTCYAVLVKKDKQTLAKTTANAASKNQFAMELISMVKLFAKFFYKKEREKREALLRKRIANIQTYVQGKYPEAEVYLFAYSNDDYRDGKHGTTMESKEASGSAYELILNYEVLMPGIQFSPVVPIHFLMPFSVNSNRSEYERLVEGVRFHFLNQFDTHRKVLVDLGSTPPLTIDYMTAHTGAIYWESFKASSGNLPKALLNLLRIEMLFDQRFNTSVIELIKNPRKLDKFAGTLDYEDEDEDFEEEEDDFFDDFGENQEQEEEEEEEDEVIGEDDDQDGMKVHELFNIEDQFPKLLQDPWWQRYKALKIAFCAEEGLLKDQEERMLVSKIIDLCFALHIRVSDVFTSPGEKRKFETHREKVMVLFLKKAFPPSKRRTIEHIFIGEVQTVLKFEQDLKFLFKNSMLRILQLVEQQPGKDQSNQDEFKIWYHYYQKNFEPPPNVVRQDILSHLKSPRGRLQVGYDEKKRLWFFKSLQKSVSSKSRFDTFGNLDHLPDEVELFEHRSFLHGMAHCIMNGYYGIFNKGTLKETRTHLEFAVAQMKMGKMSADKWAFIRPDEVTRLVDRIFNGFPPQDYDYRDCIYKEREVVDLLICLNLLEYGRLTILYRDNMKVWYVDMFDHPAIEKKAFEFYQDPEGLLSEPSLHATLAKFFEKQKIKITEEMKSHITFWVNPNSLKTPHSPDKTTQKENELAQQFSGLVFNQPSN